MYNQETIYCTFFKAQDRFLKVNPGEGFEPDIIYDYIHWGCVLTSYYEHGSEGENPLLFELHLRQVYFHLLDAIQDSQRSRTFRRVCLDSIHIPLLGLKRHYYHLEDGDIHYLSLQQQLQRIQAPHD